MMQIKIFTIPVLGGERINEEMNAFLRSRRILHVDQQLVHDSTGAFWSFSVRYLGQEPKSQKKKVDYREVLDTASFQRFSEMRKIRKELAQKEGIPAFAIFTDEELSNLAQMTSLTYQGMLQIKGIGSKKVEKFGVHFIPKVDDEKS